MSNPYDQNPQGGSSASNPHNQPSANPYNQPSANPYEQPAANPYEQSGGQYPPAGQYGQGQQYGQGGQYGQPAPYQQQPYGVGTMEHPQGTIIFVLGIVGIFVGVCAPIAWYLGNKTLREITASGANYSNLSQIKTGRILGKVFTIIYIVFIVLYIVFIVVILGIAASQGQL